jgi:hypothetical protein
VGFFGAIIFLPVYMVVVVGVSASAAGLTVMPLTLGVVVSSFLSGQIVSRVGKYKVLLLVGTAIVLVGYFLMQSLTVSTSRWDVSWRMVILGLGLGPALPIYLLAVQNAVNPREIGAATGSSQFFRQIGSTIGVAIFGTILTTTLSTQLPKYMPAEMRTAGTAAVSFNMGQLESGNFNAVGDQIRAGMQGTYQRIELVLTKNDPDARASLLADPKVPAPLKTMIENGGVAGTEATRMVLTQIKANLDKAAERITGQVTSALKTSFTEAIDRVYFWGLFVIALGFIVTLFLPELALRKTHGAAPAMGEGGAPAETGSLPGNPTATAPAAPET